jgi:hypothetical protein
VDTTMMGAGTGPSGVNFTQNRATIHLHGGATPWISDGTPQQYLTPAGELSVPNNQPYQKGFSFVNVPDMVLPGVPPCQGGSACFTPSLTDGVGTHYFQTSRAVGSCFTTITPTASPALTSMRAWPLLSC